MRDCGDPGCSICGDPDGPTFTSPRHPPPPVPLSDYDLIVGLVFNLSEDVAQLGVDQLNDAGFMLIRKPPSEFYERLADWAHDTNIPEPVRLVLNELREAYEAQDIAAAVRIEGLEG